MYKHFKQSTHGISSLYSILITIAIVLVAGSIIAFVFLDNTKVFSSNDQFSIQSANLIKDTNGNAAFSITIKNTGTNSINSLTVQLSTEQTLLMSIPTNGLEPGKSISTNFSPEATYISGQSYLTKTTATFNGGNSAAQSIQVLCQGSGAISPIPTANPSASPNPDPTPAPSPATPQNQTVYFSSTQSAVNTKTAKTLLTDQPNQQGSANYDHSNGWAYYWGIRVFKLTADGSETELTSGSPVAIATIGTDSKGNLIGGNYLKTATWTPSQTNLEPTDAIVIRVYYRCSGITWRQADQWITSQLGATSLEGQTWTVSYYLSQNWYYGYDYTYHYTGRFYWGTQTYDSHISNFTYVPA